MKTYRRCYLIIFLRSHHPIVSGRKHTLTKECEVFCFGLKMPQDMQEQKASTQVPWQAGISGNILRDQLTRKALIESLYELGVGQPTLKPRKPGSHEYVDVLFTDHCKEYQSALTIEQRAPFKIDTYHLSATGLASF